jgi:hypothetical protein
MGNNNQVHLTCPHCRQPAVYKMFPVGQAQVVEPIPFEFQSTIEPLGGPAITSRRSPSSFWHSDGATYMVAGLTGFSFVWLVVWYYEAPFALAPMAGLVTGLGLHLVKIFAYAPPKKKANPKPTTTNIKVVMTEADRGTTYLDHFRDNTIELEKLIALAHLIVDNNLTWLGRPTVCKRTALTQTDYHKIKEEFSYQGYLLDGAGNNHRLSHRGRAFLRQLAMASDKIAVFSGT